MACVACACLQVAVDNAMNIRPFIMLLGISGTMACKLHPDAACVGMLVTHLAINSCSHVI